MGCISYPNQGCFCAGKAWVRLWDRGSYLLHPRASAPLHPLFTPLFKLGMCPLATEVWGNGIVKVDTDFRYLHFKVTDFYACT